MRASPSLSQLWQPHSRLCQLCRVCEQQRSCSPGFWRKELHATESAVEVRRARRRLEDTVTDERVGLFTPDKDGDTADGAGCVPVIAARRGTVCGEVGRVLRFPSTQHDSHTLYGRVVSNSYAKSMRDLHSFVPLARRCAGHGLPRGSRSLGLPPPHGWLSTPWVRLVRRCSLAALHKAARSRVAS